MDYRREIDGLRALAVLPVILFHAGFETFSGGFVGVDVFFVISGYLITTIILAELEQGKFCIVNFYERRARRILPALFLVMLVCIPFAWFWLLPSDMKDFSQSLVAVSVFSSNILFWRESGYFDTAAELKPLLHTWSLAVEEQYYVLFPLFLMLFWRLGKRWILVTLEFVFVGSLAVAQWAAYAKPAAAFYLLPTRGWELLIGSFAAFYLSKANGKEFGKAVGEVGGWLGVALILYAVFAYSKATPFPGLYALVPTLGTGLVILFATQQTTVGKFVGNKAFVVVGLISYSAYLWHQPLFAFARHRSLTEPSHTVFLALSVLALVIAYFSWRFVETPFRDKKTIKRVNFLWFSTTGFFVILMSGSYGSTSGTSKLQVKYESVLADLKKISSNRFSLLKSDECHFTNLTKIGVQGFIDDYKCINPNVINGLKNIPIAIAGDSNAADIAISFRLNGFSPTQMTGSGCSLVPRFMSNECKLLFEKYHVELASNSYYEYILLANLLEKEEVSEQSISEMMSFWKKSNKKIIFLTGTPRFRNHYKYLLKGITPRVDLQTDSLFLSSKAKSILQDNGVYIIDRNDVFCSINECSYFSKNGAPLISDERGEHLSAEGALLFGKILFSKHPLQDFVFRNN